MYITYVAICLLGFSEFTLGNELDYDGWLQMRLMHSFDDSPVPKFIERGNISISSIRLGASNVVQIGLQDSHITQLKKLARNGGKYQLKAVVRSSSGSETTFLTSVLACHLLGMDLEDSLNVWLDSAAEPVAVNLVSRGPCTMEGPSTKMWTTNVQVKYPDGGPVPDTATYIHKLEKEREARERGDTKDNRSFLAKYWMFIVPGLILFVLMSAQNPEGGPGGGGGTGQR